jgi:hypothetical protein
MRSDEERKVNRDRMRAWRAANPGKYKDPNKFRARDWRKANPEKYREQHIKRTYGLTLAEHDAMLVKQSNRCAVCRTDKPGGRGTWHVDHCHATKVVRGLLCRRCNTALGAVGDSTELLKAMIRYLRGM